MNQLPRIHKPFALPFPSLSLRNWSNGGTLNWTSKARYSVRIMEKLNTLIRIVFNTTNRVEVQKCIDGRCQPPYDRQLICKMKRTRFITTTSTNFLFIKPKYLAIVDIKVYWIRITDIINGFYDHCFVDFVIINVLIRRIRGACGSFKNQFDLAAQPLIKFCNNLF